MRKKWMSASTFGTLGTLGLALAGSVFHPALALARDKSKKIDWLQPGFEAIIMPATDSGQSLTVRMDTEGLVLCADVQDMSGVIPAATRCNYRITPPGYHIPPSFLFVNQNGILGAIQEKLKEVGAVALAAAPIGLAAFNLGATSQGAQAVDNVMNPDPMDLVKADYELGHTLNKVAYYGEITAKKHTGVIPVGTIQFDFADIFQAVKDRVNKYIGNCEDATPQSDPVCYRQKLNETYAINIMTTCDIPLVNAGAGDPGQPELWFPTDPLPQGCADQLMQAGLPELLQWAQAEEQADQAIKAKQAAAVRAKIMAESAQAAAANAAQNPSDPK